MYQLEQFGIDSLSHQDCNQCLVNFHTASDVPVMGLKVQERGQCCQGKKKKGREKMEGKKKTGWMKRYVVNVHHHDQQNVHTYLSIEDDSSRMQNAKCKQKRSATATTT